MNKINNNLLLVGFIKKSYGILGWNVIFSYMENPSDIFKYKWICFNNKNIKIIFNIEKWKYHYNKFIVKIFNIDNRNMSDKISRLNIYVDKSNLPLVDDYIYLYEIFNFDVYIKNIKIGFIYDILNIKNNYFFLLIKNDNNEYYIPFILYKFIKSINIKKKYIKLCNNIIL